jgi:hypothetical protein
VPELEGNERRPVEALSEARGTEELMDPSPLRATPAKGALTKEDVGFLEPPFMSFAGFVPESAGSGIAAVPEELYETFALLFAFESDELRALPRRDQVVDLVLEEAIGGKGERQEKEPGETAREATHLRDDTMGCA